MTAKVKLPIIDINESEEKNNVMKILKNENHELTKDSEKFLSYIIEK